MTPVATRATIAASATKTFRGIRIVITVVLSLRGVRAEGPSNASSRLRVRGLPLKGGFKSQRLAAVRFRADLPKRPSVVNLPSMDRRLLRMKTQGIDQRELS